MTSTTPFAHPEPLRHVHDPSLRHTQRGALEVRREDIHFGRSAQGGLQVAIVVRNVGGESSDPTLARVELAEFGAFLPWLPLGEVLVPSVAPGGRVTVEFEVPPAGILADVDDVPPASRLATAVGAGDDDRAARYSALLRQMRLLQRFRPAGFDPTLQRLLEALADERAHFAANLNVFIGARAVERHVARGIQIVPGRINFAKFVVGERPDAYSFGVAATEASWEVDILAGRDRSVAPGEWIEQHGCVVYLVRMQVPEDARTGKIDVRVRRRSTWEETVVEFHLVSQVPA